MNNQKTSVFRINNFDLFVSIVNNEMNRIAPLVGIVIDRVLALISDTDIGKNSVVNREKPTKIKMKFSSAILSIVLSFIIIVNCNK